MNSIPSQKHSLYAKYLTMKLSDLSQCKKDDGVYQSLIDELSLNDFIEARQEYCTSKHNVENCSKCIGLLGSARDVLELGIVELSILFKKHFPDINYVASKAVRRLMQLPVVVVCLKLKGPGSQVLFVTESKRNVDYKSYAEWLKKLEPSKVKQGLDKETLKALCDLATTEKDRSLIKYAICKAQNLGANQARNQYGIQNFKLLDEKIQKALSKAQEIRQAIMYLASVQDKAVYTSFGLEYEDDDQCSTSSDDDFADCEWESDEDSQNIEDFPERLQAPDADPLGCENASVMESRISLATDSRVDQTDSQIIDTTKQNDHSTGTIIDPDAALQKKQNIVMDAPSFEHLLYILREVNLNWFALVGELKITLSHFSPEALSQLLLDFTDWLPLSNLDTQEETLVEQSRQSFLEVERQRIINEQQLTDSESDNPDDWLNIEDVLSEKAQAQIVKQRAIIKRKSQRTIAKRIAEMSILKRKVPKKVSRIVQKFPNIGKDIEEFVQSKRVGADAWQRTGVYTFCGYQKRGPKVTYQRIQKHLEQKYGTKISYGTVVQLSVIRNKRRISSKRYKGVARVTCRRARKGFSIRLNPDAHWSCAMYSMLDHVQLTNGKDKLILNRDDASGFRLDTTTTHKQHKSFCLTENPELTTRTDYVNKYSSTLQTSSYLFMSTNTTAEQCIGVVKAQGIHEKNPAQHAADLAMLERDPKFSSIFQDKCFDCIRVDGAGDEGPRHFEIQFLWTERHVSKGKKCTIVTTRYSGGSYLNRVELMNGCLAKGHSNLFIPSTLNGSCHGVNGIDKEKLQQNLESAIDVYIDRVNGTPCGGSAISLVKGATDDIAKNLQERRPKLITFLRGSQKAKDKLKETDPTLYKYFVEIWDIRNRHMVKELPEKYIFMLRPCYQSDCYHPVCINGNESNEDFVKFVPIPIADPERPGHYLKPKKPFLILNNMVLRTAYLSHQQLSS